MKTNLLFDMGPRLTALDGEITALFDGLSAEIPIAAPDAEDWPETRAGIIQAGQRISEAGKAAILRTFAPETEVSP